MTGTMVIILSFLIIAFTLLLATIAITSAYHNGVRDGYQNTWLPHVQEQVRREKLSHGEEVDL